VALEEWIYFEALKLLE